MRFHLTHVCTSLLFAVDVSLSKGHVGSDVTRKRASAFRAAEELQETPRILFIDQETCAVHAVGIGILTAGGNVNEGFGFGVVVGDDSRLVAQIERFGAFGQRKDVDRVSQISDLLIRFRNPVGSRRNQTFINGGTLRVELKTAEKSIAPRHLVEFLIGTDLSSGKLGKIDSS